MYTAPSSTSREDAENDELACLSAGIAGSCPALCQNMPGDHQAPGLPGGCLAAWPTLTAPFEPSPSAKGSLRWCSKSPFKTKDNTGFAARQPAWPALADLTSKCPKHARSSSRSEPRPPAMPTPSHEAAIAEAFDAPRIQARASAKPIPPNRHLPVPKAAGWDEPNKHMMSARFLANWAHSA